MWLGKNSDLYFIWFRMDGLFSAVLNIKQLAVTEFFMHESEAAIGIMGIYWLFMVKILWT